MVKPRSSRILVLAVLATAGAGAACGRGCGRASVEVDDGGAGPHALAGTDCSDGLVRCVDGRVEISRLAHVPHPCGAASEGRTPCTCPWDPVARCSTGCAVPGAVAVGDADAGARQLCQSLVPVARPALPGDPVEVRVCSDVGVACVDGIVRVCDAAGRPERVLAVCLHGCDTGLAIDHGETMIADGFTTILCRRDHAERR